MNWIEVSQEMPKKEGELIIYFRNSAGWHVGTCYWNGKNFIDLCEDCGKQEPYSWNTLITHWSYLLEAPKNLNL